MTRPSSSIPTAPELELVMLAVREPTSQSRARIRELATLDLDWNRVLELAAGHTMTPLLNAALSRDAAGVLPEAIGERLQAACRRIAFKNLATAGELNRIGRAFEREGIRMLSFKGPTLAQLAYGDLARRQFTDLDILIDQTDFHRASSLLTSMGYRIGYGLSSDQQLYHVSRHSEALFNGDVTDVDLHVRLLGERFRFALAFHELWERRQNVSVAGGSSFDTISNDDLCLYLAVHGSKHCWQRVSWIRDMAFPLQPGRGIDWPALLDRARSDGCERILLLGLSLARQVCGCTLPDVVAAACDRDPSVQQLADDVEAHFPNPRRFIGTFERFRFSYRCRGRLGEAVRWAAAMTFLPHVSDWQSLKLPKPLWFLYPLVRPVRLIAKYATRSGRN